MRYSTVTLITTLLLSAPAALALESDNSQPATIEADEVEFDFRTGTRTYKGDVVVVQGTLRITGDKLVVQYGEQEDQIESATSWGNPATFKQRPEGKDEDVYGEGNEIVLDEIENTLTLIENALMTQAGNTARGKTIVYDMTTDKMTVKGMARQQQAETGDGEDAEPETTDGRARVTISPTEQQSTGSGASTDAAGGDAASSESGQALDDTSGADQGTE
ncbi:MAG: lipopolysaccharide transport periplasmic protein LptA [Gammaproteobacteria bacterium]|nr:lipopolysaccharide transport periplasmic protein LptA [Gammaproteobacteria bacterium]